MALKVVLLRLFDDGGDYGRCVDAHRGGCVSLNFIAVMFMLEVVAGPSAPTALWGSSTGLCRFVALHGRAFRRPRGFARDHVDGCGGRGEYLHADGSNEFFLEFLDAGCCGAGLERGRVCLRRGLSLVSARLVRLALDAAGSLVVLVMFALWALLMSSLPAWWQLISSVAAFLAVIGGVSAN